MNDRWFYWGLILKASGPFFIAYLLFSLAGSDPATVNCEFDPRIGANVCEEIYHDRY